MYFDHIHPSTYSRLAATPLPTKLCVLLKKKYQVQFVLPKYSNV